MNKGKEPKKSIAYSITHHCLIVMNRFFYSKIESYGTENVQKAVPIIFAANHQGTFIDGAIIALNSNLQASFLSRADIFKNKMLLPILHAYKLVPIYRKRDGVDTKAANKDVFRDCYKMLETNSSITIFPEGSHDNTFHLRQFKKGVGRIAFGSEIKNNWELGTQIIPVGIHYEKNQSVRKGYCIEFGKPINVSDYKDRYLKDPEKTLANITLELYDLIKEKTLHIYDFENADLINEYFKMLENNDVYKGKNKLKKLKQRVDFNQNVANDLHQFSETKSDKYQSFIQLLKDYFLQLKQNNFRDWQFVNKQPNTVNIILQSVILTILLPFFVLAFANNMLVYCFTNFTIKKQFKSLDWRGTAKYITGLISGPIIFFIQAIIFGLVFNSFIAASIYFLLCPFVLLFLVSIQ